MKNTLFAFLTALVMSEEGAVILWDRPKHKARAEAKGERASLPMTEEQKAAQNAFGERLSALIQEGIDTGVAGVFITPNEKRTSTLLAATIPMNPLHATTEDGTAVESNQWALNFNVAIPEKKQAATVTADEDEDEGTPMTFEQLRAETRANRKAKK